MKNNHCVLIHGLNSRTGGGKVILYNFLSYLYNEESGSTKYMCLVPNLHEYVNFECAHITVRTLPGILRRNFVYPLVNTCFLPRYMRKHNIDVVFNFTSVPIPTRAKQIFYFDWPYAAYIDSPVWKTMDFKNRITRRAKLYFFRKYIPSVDLLICQTNDIKHCLNTHYTIKRIEVIPPGILKAHFSQNMKTNIALPAGYKLFYPTRYYPHKNLETLLPLIRLIKNKELDIKIIITLENNQHSGARKILQTIMADKLDKYIINVGYLPSEEVSVLFQLCDGLLMPTLLESHSLAYIEAMAHRKPIFTSNLGFARDVCENAAVYFDPYNPADILDKILSVKNNTTEQQRMIEAGNSILKIRPTADEVHKKFVTAIHSILSERAT
ncbi:MAG: glycosyltransferase [Salinispira sp.]